MSKQNILQITNYPVMNPIHGGQWRASSLAQELKKSDSIGEIFLFSIFAKGAYKGEYDETSPNFQTFTTDNPHKHLLGDVLSYLHTSLGQDKSLIEEFIHFVSSNKIEIILLEQPYLINLCIKAKQYKPSIKLIYSSHNLEYLLKKDIYNSILKSDDEKQLFLSMVKEAEDKCVKHADYIICASKNEFLYFAGKHHKVIHIPNGTRPLPKSPNVKNQTTDNHQIKPSPFALFVGSYHPPNIDGFINLIGFDISLPNDNMKIIIAGDVKIGLEESTRYKVTPHIELLGRVTDYELAELYRLSSVILLPIDSGDGTNLKTAEALSSDRPIIAAPHSMRGFEKYEKEKNVFIAKTKADFHKLIAEVLGTNTKLSREPINDVLWSHQTSGLNDFLNL